MSSSIERRFAPLPGSKLAVAVALAWHAWVCMASAQPATLDAERARISTERAAVVARFGQRENDCRRQFFVSDCVSEAKAERRERLDDLRRQEVRVNDVERRNRSSDAQTRVAEKNSMAAASDRAEKVAIAQAASAERLVRQQNKALTPGAGSGIGSRVESGAGLNAKRPAKTSRADVEVLGQVGALTPSHPVRTSLAAAAPGNRTPPLAQVQADRSAREVERRAAAAARAQDFEGRRARQLERDSKDGGKRSAPLPTPSN